ncbi:hypothetical protein LTR86_000738 [Recurvomyces mirabilis]|nr:hypothetical protein LTR86_000738 [Recurvomyces mirabilis]
MIRVIEANKDLKNEIPSSGAYDWCIQCMLYVVLDRNHLARSVWGPGDQKKWAENAMAFRVTLRYSQAGDVLKKAYRKEVPFFDANTAKCWLDECENDHGPMCQAVAQDMPPDFLVIDTEDMCIVGLPPHGEFIALSYTWMSLSLDEQLQLTCDNEADLRQPGALSTDKLPRVVKDSAELCKKLGRRFLWVDRLCIVQDDVFRKGIQIQAMDRVYRAAVLTIVAAADSSPGIGLPGVTNERRTSIWSHPTLGGEARMVDKDFRRIISTSTWNTRGWTFQERMLSMRCLYVADDAFYFTCHRAAYQESLGQILRFSSEEEAIFDSKDLDSVATIDNAAGCLECCEHYSQPNLKSDTDVLDAFQGVSNVLSQRLDSRFLWGVPERYLVSAMLWTPKGDLTRRLSRPDGPTWSCAGWRGPIQHGALGGSEGDDANMVGTLVRSYTIHDNGTLNGVPVLETSIGKAVSFDRIDDNVYRIVQNANLTWGSTNQKSWPGPWETTQVWSQCPQNPYTVVDEDVRSPLSIMPSEIRARALVFRTTTALLHVYQKQREPDSDSPMKTAKLYSHGERLIGSLMPMASNHFWTGDEVEGVHKFIVLCASIQEQGARKPMRFIAKGHGKEAMAKGYSAFRDTMWELRLMLIMRDEQDPRLCRRVAIAWVAADDWRHCAPVWNDIVLI